MPQLLMCRRCGTAVHQDDAFCQECGLQHADPATKPATKTGSPERKLGAQMTDFDWPAMDPDPVPQFSKFVVDGPSVTNVSGQTYAFAHYQLDLQSLSDEEISAAEYMLDVIATDTESTHDFAPIHDFTPEIVQDFTPEPVHDFTPPSGTPESSPLENHSTVNSFSAKRLHSPMFDVAANNAITGQDNGLGMRGGWAMVALDLAMVAAVVTFASVLIVWVYSDFEKQDHASTRKIVDAVRVAAAKEDYQAIFTNLSKLKSKTTLDLRQQALMDESAYRLGEKAYNASNDTQAKDYFKQVSVQSNHYVRVQQILFNYTLPESTPAPSAVPIVDPAQAAPKTRQKLSAQSSDMPKQISDRPVLSIPVIPEIEKANSEKQGNSDSASAKIEEPPIPKFSESEISRYNRLLAGYFSKHSESSNEETGSSASAGAGEPPSFKEWLKQNKPAF